jgi:ketosteroid isomerase-like protein
VKILAWIILGVCLMFVDASAVADAQKGARPLAVVHKKFLAFNQHDVDAIKRLYAPAAVLKSPDYSALVGNAPIAETYRKLFDAIPDAQDTVERMEFAGKHVYVQFILSGHWKGMPDRPVSAHIMAVYEVEGGRIVDDATYYDRKGS